jgi:hypothetical protein
VSSNATTASGWYCRWAPSSSSATRQPLAARRRGAEWGVTLYAQIMPRASCRSAGMPLTEAALQAVAVWIQGCYFNSWRLDIK